MDSSNTLYKNNKFIIYHNDEYAPKIEFKYSSLGSFFVMGNISDEDDEVEYNTEFIDENDISMVINIKSYNEEYQLQIYRNLKATLISIEPEISLSNEFVVSTEFYDEFYEPFKTTESFVEGGKMVKHKKVFRKKSNRRHK